MKTVVIEDGCSYQRRGTHVLVLHGFASSSSEMLWGWKSYTLCSLIVRKFTCDSSKVMKSERNLEEP